MRKLLLLSGLLALASAATAQLRFVDAVVSRDKITRIDNVTYSQNYTVLYGDLDPNTAGNQFQLETLKMDVYTPDDNSTNRPLVILLHSGSFLPRYLNQTPTGAKNDSHMVEMATQWAQRGYVVASITYRQGWNPQSMDETVRRSTIINAAYKGVQDLSACIRFFKENAAAFGNTFSIDTSKIAVGGVGTGSYITSAFASLDRQDEITIAKFRDPSSGAVFVDDKIWGDRFGFGGVTSAIPGVGGPFNKENGKGYTSKAGVAFQIGGALGDSSWLEAGQIPLIWAHSVSDPFAPYTTGMVNVPGTPLKVVEVSGGYDIMKRATSLGNTDAYKGKVMDDWTRAANKFNNGIDGLLPIVGLVNSSGPYEWWDTAAIKLLPNPPYNVPAILGSGKATNPLMSRTRALTFIDTLMGYIAPRVAVTLGLQTSVGVENVNLASNVTVYPNPAHGQVIIHNNWDNRTLEQVVFRDINGKTIKSTAVHHNHIVEKLDMPAGIYIVEMQFNNGVGTTRLVVQ